MIDYIIVFSWLGLMGWAFLLTLLSKRMSKIEKIIICVALASSFYLMFQEEVTYEDIFNEPESGVAYS